jgi:hypothetical protein
MGRRDRRKFARKRRLNFRHIPPATGVNGNG